MLSTAGVLVSARKAQNPAPPAIISSPATAAIHRLRVATDRVDIAPLIASGAGEAAEEPLSYFATAEIADAAANGVGATSAGASSTTTLLPESVSRFRRCRSARISAAC